MLTENVRGAVRCKLVDDSFVPETRLELETIQETIGEQTTNIREDGKNNNRPPRPAIEWQALRQTIVKSQEGAFHRPGTREEDIRKTPLGFRILSCYLFPIRRFRFVVILDALEDPGVVSFSAFKNVGCEKENKGEDDEIVVDFQVAIDFYSDVEAGAEENEGDGEEDPGDRLENIRSDCAYFTIFAEHSILYIRNTRSW